MKIILLISVLFLGCNKNSSSPQDNLSSYPFHWKDIEPDGEPDGVLDNFNDYQNNGSITSTVFMNDVNLVSPGDLLAAFIGSEQRGAAIPTGPIPWGPYEGTYQFLMLIYSNASSGETINFQFYDNETDAVFNMIETYQFISDMKEGDIIAPIVFTVQEN